MRKLSNKTITKIFLGILVLVFASFGLSNFRSSKDSVALIDGKPAVSFEDFAREKRAIIQSMSRYYPNLNPDTVDFDQLALNQLVRNRLIDLEVKKLGLNISDDLALDIIQQNKLFHNKEGRFDKTAFKTILAANHVSESDYVKGIKLSIAASFFSKNMTGFSIPDTIVKQFYSYDNQERKVELFVIDKINNSTVQVSDKEILSFYEANKDRFYAPELREIEYLLIDQIKKEKNGGLQKIRDIEKSLDEGKKLKDIAEKFKVAYKKLLPLDAHGFYSGGKKDGVPNAKFLEEAFSLTEGVPSEVLKIGENYYVINVVKIEARYLKSVDQVKASIVSELRDSKSVNDNAKFAADVRHELISNPGSSKYFSKAKNKIILLKRPRNAAAVESIPVSSIVNIFTLENLGQYTDVFQLQGGGFGFAKLLEIQNPNGVPGKELQNALPQIFSSIANQDFMSYLHKKYKVEVYPKNIIH